MKRIILLLAFMSSITLVSAQIKVGGTESESIVNYEYATVHARIFYQNNQVIYDENGHALSPMVYLPNGDHFVLKNSLVTGKEQRFTYLNDIINFMAMEGWRLKSSIVLPNNGDNGYNNSINRENWSEFIQQLIFERKIN